MLKFLEGKKTYLLALVAGLASGAKYLGWISEETYVLIIGLTGAGAAGSIRSAIKSASK